MTRLGWAIFYGLMIGGTATADEARDARLRERLAAGVLRWGGDAEGGAPYQLRDPQNPSRVIGYEVELADALVDVLGHRLSLPLRAEFVQYKWVELIPGLQKGDFDVILSGLEISADNAAKIRFSRPYYVYALQLVVARDEQRIGSLGDCLHRRVGTLGVSAAARYLESAGIGDVRHYEGQVEPLRDLTLGRLDAVLLDLPAVTFCVAPFPDLKLAGPPVGRGRYGIGMLPADVDLAEAIDEALGELACSGRLRDIYRKWRLWNIDQADLAGTPPDRAELQGLGFSPTGEPLPADELPHVTPVDRNLIASSSEQWTFSRYAPLLVSAAGMTVFLTVCSMLVAMVLGLLVTLCRLYGPAPVRWGALIYVEFFRGIPLLLLLTFLYFGLPEFGLELPAVVTAIVGFGMNYGAYEAEIYRSAILSVPRGQWEAGRALAMPEPMIFRRVVFPQAFRTALGPMTNDFVAMFKDTSLVSVIAVNELTTEYSILARSSLKFVEIGLLTAGLYLAMSVPLGYLSRYLEHRWGGAGRG